MSLSYSGFCGQLKEEQIGIKREKCPQMPAYQGQADKQ